MKILITITLFAILLSLGTAGVLMLRTRPDDDAQRSRQMARALAWRIGLSIALFAAVLLAWRLGWLHPTGLPLPR
ncbi:DUF2909 domain-containing protein [Ideonella sp. B7]|uniref:DUF2909 domain-containing protein n=1 Tax=Ideonella benzenivorans TaxID=2831643 RepID=UPI001CEC0C80|nr:DUF2909 domain-containing protein [Ideonella benzenivorans]MCA6218916.1 DUF2909 domain-containing protein [Ideonella benzenivorans]